MLPLVRLGTMKTFVSLLCHCSARLLLSDHASHREMATSHSVVLFHTVYFALLIFH